MYEHWFVSRPKRQLTTILQCVVAFSDVCLGEVWSGNHDLQLKFEDELQHRSITEHGNLRARKSGAGGGGTRTLFKQMKDLGLVFTEDENGKCRLTLVGESLVKGEISFVEAMRMQLQKYQYPSATSCRGSGAVSESFRVHPFQFMFRLLRDPRLDNILNMDEMYGIVIHQADSDSESCLEKVIGMILKHRQGVKVPEFRSDTDSRAYSNIANTFFNYISLCQYTDRGMGSISIRSGKEADADAFIQESPKFFKHPELTENYIRAYGRGRAAKDLRNFDRDSALSQKELNEARIQKEYVLLALKTPITGITPDVVSHITAHTGIDEKTVEKYLLKTHADGNIGDFFLSYRELAQMSREGAKDFELATCEVFNKIFKMKATHTGPKGNTPDVFVESDEYNFCGIIDNKAYKKGYCISGDHLRVMEDVYIPNYRTYGETDKPLAFYTYISGSFGANMNSWLKRITADTGINGSAMPVDLFINFAQDYAEKKYTHGTVRNIFSLNREVTLSDITSLSSYSSSAPALLVAERGPEYMV